VNLGETIRHGALWLFIGNSGNQVLSFLAGIVLARLLVPEVFGVLMTMQVFTGLAGFVAGGGMGQALVRAKTAEKKDYDIVFTLQLLIGVLIYAGFYFAAPWFARWYHNPLYIDLLRVAALSFILRPFFNLPGNILFRQMRFRAKAVIGLINLIVSSTTSIVMAWKGFGIWSLVAGGIAGSVSGILLSSITARWFPRLRLDFRRAKPLLRYGMLVSLNDILLYIRRQTTTFILSRSLGPKAVAIYNKGDSLAFMPQRFITHSVYEPLFRALSKEQANLDRSRYLYFHALSLVSVYVLPLCLGLYILADPFILLVYGNNWVEASTPIRILVFAIPFAIIDNLSGSVLAARNWLNREAPVQVIMVVVTALAVAGGLRNGLVGVAWGVVIANIYVAIHMAYLAGTCLQARMYQYITSLFPAALLNSLLFGFSYIIQWAFSYKQLDFDLLSKIIIIGVTCTMFYLALILVLPIPSLSGERDRLKRIIFSTNHRKYLFAKR